ncbi:MAG: hypothetical protein JWM87_3561 [Candidatus Eremiobacteraeota bacterium]|nr:hypothetical protein [Candidatus Eremiobacteraeota bacterium]
MDVDALARELAEAIVRFEFASPPFPPHVPAWVERVRTDMPEEFEAARDAFPALRTYDRTVHERVGDFDVYLYRVEPGAFALLLFLRGTVLEYIAFAGSWFMLPEHVRKGSHFPPFDLTMMAVGARAEAELDLQLGGLGTQGDGPVGVGFEIERARYESLDEAAREALHQACAPIARDAALLVCGRSSPVTVRFVEPAGNDVVVDDAGVQRVQFHVDTTKPGSGRDIAEFDIP